MFLQRFFALSMALVVCGLGNAAHAATPTYVEGVVQRSRDLHLSESEQWRRLLHYQPKTFGGYESEADGEPFFNAPNGKTEPQAELEATLRAFFVPVPTDPKVQHPLCRFPARFGWLDEQLHFDRGQLPQVHCAEYEEFLRLLKPRGLTLVFSSYYLNNPASAFGHTFLRVDQAQGGEDESRDLLDYGVDYSANVDVSNAILYAFKGIFGLFPGTFQRMPYARKVREYSDFESRDLWEYDLELSPVEVKRVVDHIWELGHTYFAYYYLTENCSYQVLGILEAANPRLQLLKGLNKPVIPADTVKALFKNPGLVRRVKYRPSNRTQFRLRMSDLTAEERDAVALLMSDPNAALPTSFDVTKQVRALDAAIDLIDVQLSRDTVKAREEMDAEGTEKQQALLLRRANYDVQTEAPKYPPPLDQMPQLGHGSQRLGLGSGWDHQRGYFHTLNFRLALHDLTDPGVGFPDGSEIEFLPLRLRYYVETPKLSLEELTLIRVKSLTPLGRFNRSWSWLVDAGSHKNHDRGCDNCYSAFGRFGAGLALQPLPFFTLFALGTAQLDAPLRSGLLDVFRFGVGPFGGLRLRFGEISTLLVSGQWAYLPGQHPMQTFEANAQLRVNYAKNFSLGAEGRAYQRTQSLELTSYLYF